MDIENQAEVDAAVESVKQEVGNLDGILHAIAFSPTEAMGGNFLNTNIADAVKSFEISAFSLKTFGFLLPTALASAALSYLIQPSIFKSSATGLILSLSL